MHINMSVAAPEALTTLNRLVSLLRGRRYAVTRITFENEAGVARIAIVLDEDRVRAKKAAACIERLECVFSVRVDSVATTAAPSA